MEGIVFALLMWSMVLTENELSSPLMMSTMYVIAVTLSFNFIFLLFIMFQNRDSNAFQFSIMLETAKVCLMLSLSIFISYGIFSMAILEGDNLMFLYIMIYGDFTLSNSFASSFYATTFGAAFFILCLLLFFFWASCTQAIANLVTLRVQLSVLGFMRRMTQYVFLITVLLQHLFNDFVVRLCGENERSCSKETSNLMERDDQAFFEVLLILIIVAVLDWISEESEWHLRGARALKTGQRPTFFAVAYYSSVATEVATVFMVAEIFVQPMSDLMRLIDRVLLALYVICLVCGVVFQTTVKFKPIDSIENANTTRRRSVATDFAVQSKRPALLFRSKMKHHDQ